MDSNAGEVVHEFPPFFRVYQNGTVQRFMPSDRVPPSTDPRTGVRSKDVTIDPKTGVSVRIYLPPISDLTVKFPLLIYIHGGGFTIGSAFSAIYHRHLTSLVAQSNVVALSVDYRLAPEHPLPASFDDAWAVAQWAALHSTRDGPESWLNDHADFQRVFFIGDSAGANISYNVVGRASELNGPDGLNIVGMGLVHPFFMINKPDKLIDYIFPSTNGLDDPRMNPRVNPKLRGLRCSRVVVYVAEHDWLKDRGHGFYAALKESGWPGAAEIVETAGEGHVFHLFDPKCEKAVEFVKLLASFIQSSLKKPSPSSSL